MSGSGTPASRCRWAMLRHTPYVLLIYVARVLVALILGYGFSKLAQGSLGSWPRGDAMLFDPGGLVLAEAIRLNVSALAAMGHQALMLVLVMIPVGLVPLAMLTYSLGEPRRVPIREALDRAVRRLVPMAVLGVIFLAIAAGCVGFFYLIAQALSHKLGHRFGVRGGDIARGSLVVAGVVLAWVSAIVHDIGRVAVVCRGMDSLRALSAAWSTALHRPVATATAYGSRGAAMLTAIVGGAILVGRAGVDSQVRVLAGAMIHQCVILVLIVLRASWLARVVQLLPDRATHDSESETVSANVVTYDNSER